MGALRDAFLKELNKFNNGDYSNLVLHPEVIMNEVDPPYGIHCGKKDVIDYLNQYQTAPFPKLFADPDDLDNPPGFTPSLYESPYSPNSHGQVSGICYYQDNSVTYMDDQGVHAQSQPYLVRYIFNLRYDDGSGAWLLINATATKMPEAGDY
jgi:hypothetical protein